MVFLEKRYFAYPNSLDPIGPTFKHGLIAVALCATLSLLSVTILLAFITNRLISWRKHYKEYVGYNQYVILIYNLLLADLQQSIAFSVTYHWLRLDKILAPTVACFIQGWFLHIGDVSSGFFVLAIAIHTWMGVVKGYKLPYRWFVVSIISIWMFALFLTILGPLMHGKHYFTRAGGWCWVSIDFEQERLWLHYFWIFIIEFGTIAIYGHIFIHLRGRIQTIINNDTTKLSRAAKFMILYPAAYVIMTLPLALGRMVTMAGVDIPDAFFCVAGSLLTSCGWIDALLYTLTRRVLVSNQLSTGAYSNHIMTVNTNAVRPGDDVGLNSISKEVGTARTVTIVGGSNRKSRMLDSQRNGRGTGREMPLSQRDLSPTGSQDSIMKPEPNTIGIVTETNIQVETTHVEDSSSDFASSPAESRNRSESAFSTQTPDHRVHETHAAI